MASITPITHTLVKEIVSDLGSLIRIYDDGTIERPIESPLVPPNLYDPVSGISSKDIVITQNPKISARIYLPKITKPDHKIPIYTYFHGGGFLFESAFSKFYTDHHNKLLSAANVLVVSVEYRIAPETPLPACYHDCWEALKWVASHRDATTNNKTEPWLIDHGDFNRVFIGGDSAGGNIVHNIAMRAGAEALPCGLKIQGALMMHPFFFGSEPVGAEILEEHQKNSNHEVWKLAYPNAPGGIDNPMVNILAPGAPSLATLGCTKIIVFVAGKDCLGLRERGVWYYEAVKNSGWEGKIEFYEDEDEDHVYYMFKPECENANKMIKRMASFFLE